MLSAIRPAHPHEAPILSQLAWHSKAYWGYDAAFMAACSDELTVSPDRIRRDLTYVIEANQRIVGFYTLGHRTAEEVELDLLFVAPEAIGKGYGRHLMEHAVAQAHARGYRTIRIQADPYAEPFYRAMGGVVVGHTPSDSIPGRVLPLLMLAVGDSEDDAASLHR